MKNRLTALAAACLAGVCLATGLTVPLGARDAAAADTDVLPRASAPLRVTPEKFVGGQALTFVGRIPGASNAPLKVQSRYNRPGDGWITVPGGVVGRSDARGGFRFVHTGPNSIGTSYRVKAVGGGTSAPVRFEPRQQEIVLRLDDRRQQRSGTVLSGRSFTIDVDTTPTGRGDLARTPPAFEGRPLTLQQRVRGDEWATIATSVASAAGTTQFRLTAGAPGTTAYRVRQEAITTGGNAIGWFPSYPLGVRVVAPGSGRVAVRPTPYVVPRRAAVETRRDLPPAGPAPARETQAARRYSWGPTRFDFAWEKGESLTDRPARGTDRTGAWIDRSNGSGRAAHYNGGLALSSGLSESPGRGDRGTASATLTGNALTYGRWEFRRRIDVFESAGKAYRIRIELVPAEASDARCGARTITVADVAYNSRTARVGVTSASGASAWTGSRRIPRLGDRPHAFGVEVTRGHITWFLNGRSLASVRNPKAVPDVPLTPRLSIVGAGSKEMQRTRVLYDWQRGWELNRQARRAAFGPALPTKMRKTAC